MEGIPFEGHVVYLYASMLHTRSPLLKEIYCESHRFEPWAVTGSEARYGFYPFPGVLYVPEERRTELLGAITLELEARPDFVWSLAQRFRGASIALLRALRRARRGDETASNTERLLDLTARVLSSGIFKEVFEHEQALLFLSRTMPVEGIREDVLALYQPMCLPHFLLYELRLLHAAERYDRAGAELVVRRCIERSAHLTRFLVEDSPLADPDAMRREIERALTTSGGDPKGERRRLLARHRKAIASSFEAEHRILARLDRFGRYSLGAKLVVMSALRFIRFLATYEELKHIQAVETARAVRRLIGRTGLTIEEAGRVELLQTLRGREHRTPILGRLSAK